MHLQSDELQPFLVLAEELHFCKAAERLYISQPALSKQIRRLEEKLGGPLFTRTRRKVALTETGRVLIPIAEKLARESRIAFDAAHAAAQGRAGILRIGFGIASVSSVLPRTILRFRRENPLVELYMRDMSTPSQIAALLDGKIDIGIVRIPVAHTELDSRPLFSDRLVAAVPRSVPYRRTERLAGLRDRPFICLPRSVSETFHEHVFSLCRRAGFTPRVVQEASELFTILNLVRAGLGVSLVPSSAVLLHVPGVHFHDLQMPEAEWRIGVAWNKQAEKIGLIARFVTTIQSVVAK
jgi:DNA-binding transcriptional LysR family regulator